MTEHLGSGTRTANGIPSSGSFFSRSQRATTRRFVFNFRWWRDGHGREGEEERGAEGRREDYGNEAHFQPSMKYSPVERGISFLVTMEFCDFVVFFLSFFPRMQLYHAEKGGEKKKEKRKRNSCLNIYYSYYLQF